MKTIHILLALVAALAAHAGPSSSVNYNVVADTLDIAGIPSGSINYTNQSSMGGVAGLAAIASPTGISKSGYIAQLYEVTGLQLAATPASVDEDGTRQLSGVPLLDDGTTLAVPPGSISWSIQSGPLSSISPGGLAAASTVYEDTVAVAQGSYAGKAGTLDLTVVNVNLDDLPGYSADGIDDAWQVQYFGLNNPNAAPLLDADGDGQNNSFEFIAGLVPTNAGSKFSYRIEPVPGFPSQIRIVFSPRLASRNYEILTSLTLAPGSWNALVGGVSADMGNERSITDLNTSGSLKFYQVRIVKP